MSIPARLRAGTTIKFTVSLPCYKASNGWEASLYLRGPASLTLAAEADGDNFLFSKEAGAITPASGSSAWIAGVYFWALQLTKDDEVIEVENGSLEILPSLLDSNAEFQAQSQVKRTLDAINAVLEKRASKDQQRYSIEVNGSRRELWRVDISDLLKLKDRYQALYNQEVRSKHGRSKFGPRYRVRF